jgi:hypothetical protein
MPNASSTSDTAAAATPPAKTALQETVDNPPSSIAEPVTIGVAMSASGKSNEFDAHPNFRRGRVFPDCRNNWQAADSAATAVAGRVPRPHQACVGYRGFINFHRSV